jgi:HAD superfamily hydrolase (TIGR01509 family)
VRQAAGKATQSGAGALAAVLFDMDGLLVDSEPLWYDVEAEIAAALGGEWLPADQAACVGGPLRATARLILARAARPADLAEVESRLIHGMAERLRRGVPLLPGAADLLAGLARCGIATALVSSSERRLMDLVLAGVQPASFTASVAGDEVCARKPDPEAYLRAAGLLGVEPGWCVALEDSRTGVMSAEAAGCLCVAVPDLVPIPTTPTRPVLTSLRDIDAEWLVALPQRLRPVCRTDGTVSQ